MCKWCVTYRWKDLDEGYNFSLKLVSIEGLHKKLWASKVAGDLISKLPLTWGSWEKMTFICSPLWLIIENTIRGRWWLPPSLGCGESCESVCARGSSMHQKCSNYALTNLFFGLCRFVWIINQLVTHLNHHFKAPTRPFTLEVLQARERIPTPFSSVVFTFGLAFESYEEFGGASISLCAFFGDVKTKRFPIL